MQIGRPLRQLRRREEARWRASRSDDVILVTREHLPSTRVDRYQLGHACIWLLSTFRDPADAAGNPPSRANLVNRSEVSRSHPNTALLSLMKTLR
jgi:hypothetical protein